MVLMALDHTRDYLGNAAANPVDMRTTTVALFFTRWVTHICAPTFVFLAGMAIAFQLGRGEPRNIARFLVLRGLWLCLLELTVVHALWLFNWKWNVQLLEVIWVIGLSMIIMGALVRLPVYVAAVVGALMVAGHNLLDGAGMRGLGPYLWVWRLLHAQGFLTGDPQHLAVLVAYPLIPWPGVMALGYCFGIWWLGAGDQRHAWLVRIGVSSILAFLLLRALNGYGDPRPWAPQATGGRTVLSFLNVTKYPVSFQFVLAMLGLAILLLAIFDWAETSGRLQPGSRVLNVMNVFGRVPMFYFLVHICAAHALAVGLALARGQDWRWFFSEPLKGGVWIGSPPGWGISLPYIWLAWIAVVASSYPICAWYARLKATSKNPLLSYL
jgi:uncharacterized membrane protein